MVEETANVNKPKTRQTNRPKAVYLWTVNDVQKWLRRHCGDYFPLYFEKFLLHDITGRALVRMNDNTLMRLGISDANHRMAILREIMKLRLKNDRMEIADLQMKSSDL